MDAARNEPGGTGPSARPAAKGEGSVTDLAHDGDTEWIAGPDAIPERNAARVVLFDPDGRTLLVRGHDIDDAGRFWWFTVGGGIRRGEGSREGACRELAEETGLGVEPARLEGPVLRRTAAFRFVRQTRRQHEEFFLLRLDAEETARLGAGRTLTALEQEVLDEFRWWPVDELAALAARETLYPIGLARLAPRWLAGWDGVCLRIEEP